MTIPETVIAIGRYAFTACYNLESFKVENENPANISIGSSIFYRCPKYSCVLYVPNGSKDLYANADQWKDFQYIEEFDNTPSSINTVEYPTNIIDNIYYDLTGRPFVNPRPGIYIQNGRKVLVK